MVRTVRCVARDTAAEFAEGHSHHSILDAHELQVVLEGADVVAHRAQQVGVRPSSVVARIHLRRVRVEATDAYPVDLRFQATTDQLRNHLEGLCQPVRFGAEGRVEVAVRAVGARRGFDHVAVEVGLALYRSDGAQLVTFAIRRGCVHVDVPSEVERIVRIVDADAHVHPHVLEAGTHAAAHTDGQRMRYINVRVAHRIVRILVVEVAS